MSKRRFSNVVVAIPEPFISGPAVSGGHSRQEESLPLAFHQSRGQIRNATACPRNTERAARAIGSGRRLARQFLRRSFRATISLPLADAVRLRFPALEP